MNLFKRLTHKRAENVLKIVEKAHLLKRYILLQKVIKKLIVIFMVI